MSTARPTGPPPRYIRQSQLHRYYPVLSASTWRRLIRDGTLASRRIGNAVIIATDDIEQFLRSTDTAASA